MSVIKDWKGKNNTTFIKIKTKDNMIYTLDKYSWAELSDDPEYISENGEFNSIEEYVKYVAGRRMQGVVDTNKDLIYLYLESRVVNKNDIKEMFIETHKPLQDK